jgi:hypothetical protein
MLLTVLAVRWCEDDWISHRPDSGSEADRISSECVLRWVRICCFMLSLRVKALLQIGQCTLFSPVCFLPWRAAWPEVVNVAVQP